MIGPVAIIGMGKSGSSALALLLALGVRREEILTFDQRPGLADTSDPLKVQSFAAKIAVVSPGVPLVTPWIQALKSSGVEITSEISLTIPLLKDEVIIGVTGSVGKSTTTAALGAAVSAIDPHCFVGGNLGTPLSIYGHDLLVKKRPRAKVVVLELSSFQLENCRGLILDASILTFLSANHLERYRNLEDYYETKFKIDTITKGPVFMNFNGGDLLKYFKKSRPDHEDLHPSRYIWVKQQAVCPLIFQQAALLGTHNRDNLALAWHAVKHFQWGDECIRALMDFSGLPHRLQKVGEYHGVLFINDSKATALDSVTTALESCLMLGRKGRVFLLLGGRDKNLPWNTLSPLIKTPKVVFCFFGECAEKAKEMSGLPGPVFASLAGAVHDMLTQVSSGDTLLLSPGGTSLDEFKNFEDRGDCFIRLVADFSTGE